MSSHDPFELPVDSPQCRFLCAALNDARPQAGAQGRPELFSGGFKFSDEIPRSLFDSDEHVLQLVTLMRCLWGYRASLVRGEPRSDLAPYWNVTKQLAPNWAGFAAERCSPRMMEFLDGPVREQFEAFVNDCDRLDASLSRTPSVVS